MRVYLLTDEDIEALTAAIDRDPMWGTQGGSSCVMTEKAREAHEEAHRFFNYQVRAWIDRVTAKKECL